MSDFNKYFRELTTHSPFHWQEQLYTRLISGDFPDVCDIPTGLGKTNVMAVWLIALANQIGNPERKLPLRLVYVVDRRVIVDQATTEATELINRLVEVRKNGSGPLREIADRLAGSSVAGNESVVALSTLRGQKADNRQWCIDPSQPAIIVGTVDMIGSRILFSGYGKVGLNHRSLQAGLLGQDSLIVIDEAHLSPCFVDTQTDVRQYVEQYQSIRPFYVMSLSATLTPGSRTLALDEARECQNPIAEQRLKASKTLELIRYNRLETASPEKPASPTEVQTDLVEKMVTRALDYENDHSGTPTRSIIIFASTVKLVNEITDRLRSAIGDREMAKLGSSDPKIRREVEAEADNRILKLTGEMRGAERDELVKTDKFKSFLPNRQRDLPGATRYLVATSCAEVGVNIDADHGLCDLTSLDSMIQRIGRINRFGHATSTVTVMVNDAALHATESDRQKHIAHNEFLRQVEIDLAEMKTEIAAGPHSKDGLKIWKKKLTAKENVLKSLRKGQGPELEYKKVERVRP
ncbi:MAG: CRISPR-associated helicase Cas3 [Acidobacteriota bacterium]